MRGGGTLFDNCFVPGILGRFRCRFCLSLFGGFPCFCANSKPCTEMLGMGLSFIGPIWWGSGLRLGGFPFLFSRSLLLGIRLLLLHFFPPPTRGVRGFGGGRLLVSTGLFGINLRMLLGLSLSSSIILTGNPLLGGCRGLGSATLLFPWVGGSPSSPVLAAGLGGPPPSPSLGRVLRCFVLMSTSAPLSGRPSKSAVVHFSLTLPTAPTCSGLRIISLPYTGCRILSWPTPGLVLPGPFSTPPNATGGVLSTSISGGLSTPFARLFLRLSRGGRVGTLS